MKAKKRIKKPVKKITKKKQSPKKRVRIKYKNVLIFFIFVVLLFLGIKFLLKIPISNIYIKGNNYQSDQEIIELLQIGDYPPIIDTFFLDKKAKKSPLITKITVKHKRVRELHIEVFENIPLFYNSTKQKSILKDGKEVSEKYDTPLLLNYVPDKKYSNFLKKMALMNPSILEKISEIKYAPNDKDDERFLLSMNDGNYVYVTLGYFDRVNNYLNIMIGMSKKFNNKKGILYLDSGSYFEVLENN